MKIKILNGFIVISILILSIFFSNEPNKSYYKENDYTIKNNNNNTFKVNKNNETYGTFKVNANGETIEPDLIGVIGVNNVEGYVKKSDLYDEENQPKNPEEAIKYLEEGRDKKVRIINVYKSDGETIIGKYKVGASNN